MIARNDETPSDEHRMPIDGTHSVRAAAGSRSDLLRARDIAGFVFGNSRIDVRGWPVRSSDNALIGSVQAMFVDARTKAIRYLGVALDNGSRASSAVVLVPIGATARPAGRRSVVLRTLSARELEAAPRVAERPVTKADEGAALRLIGIATRVPAHPDVYNSPLFDERRLFGDAATIG